MGAWYNAKRLPKASDGSAYWKRFVSTLGSGWRRAGRPKRCGWHTRRIMWHSRNGESYAAGSGRRSRSGLGGWGGGTANCGGGWGGGWDGGPGGGARVGTGWRW